MYLHWLLRGYCGFTLQCVVSRESRPLVWKQYWPFKWSIMHQTWRDKKSPSVWGSVSHRHISGLQGLNLTRKTRLLVLDRMIKLGPDATSCSRQVNPHPYTEVCTWLQQGCTYIAQLAGLRQCGVGESSRWNIYKCIRTFTGRKYQILKDSLI